MSYNDRNIQCDVMKVCGVVDNAFSSQVLLCSIEIVNVT